jgi:hypothetical protein
MDVKLSRFEKRKHLYLAFLMTYIKVSKEIWPYVNHKLWFENLDKRSGIETMELTEENIKMLWDKKLKETTFYRSMVSYYPNLIILETDYDQKVNKFLYIALVNFLEKKK